MERTLRELLGSALPPALVVGDLILDRYIWGEVDRISPEAPVQVLRWRSENEALGGAANVAHNLAALGCPVHLAGAVGDDEEGERLLSLARERGVEVGAVVRLPGRPTTVKTRVLARNQHVLRIDREETGPLEGSWRARLASLCLERLGAVRGLVVSDYAKGVVTAELLQVLFSEAASRGLPRVVDPKGEDVEKYRGATVLKPNLEELAQAAGKRVAEEGELAAAVEALFRRAAVGAVLLTRGSRGMSLFRPGLPPVHDPAQAREVFDVTGAGDTATAAFSLCLFAGADPVSAMRAANLAAGLVVQKLGTAVVRGEELLAAGDEQRLRGAPKVLPLPELLARLSLARNLGRRVVFTNGCFDLLHVGHIQFLQQARSLGDLLVVGLNDDDSVRRLKGPGRPLIEGAQRAELVAALACVDFVVFFSEDTPLPLLQAVRPDVLVKGGDYSLEEVVGRELVESYGGRVLTLPLVEGFSTTGIVNTIVERYAGARPGEPARPRT